MIVIRAYGLARLLEVRPELADVSIAASVLEAVGGNA